MAAEKSSEKRIGEYVMTRENDEFTCLAKGSAK